MAHYRTGDWHAALDALNKSQELAGGNDGSAAFDWFFMAMARWRLDEKDEARLWYDRAVGWMDEHAADNEELIRFRAEAAELLGVSERAATDN